MAYMKKILLLLTLTVIISARGPFDSPLPRNLDFSAFNTNKYLENEQAVENEKIICRKVCDKKIYKEQIISEAINFYKSSKVHHFDGNSYK
ncbi:MAG: hypothetical protein OQK11_01745 [Thiovulaceae bacterium]|nr:hypothetical protein [Sulfurimonadaceae bacterium]